MSDQTINCIDCKKDFQFTEGEARFFQDRGLKRPRRCKECRTARKQGGGQQQYSKPPRVQEQFPDDMI